MTEITVAIIGGFGVVLSSWLQNRKTRKAVQASEPASQALATDVRSSLELLHEKVDRVDAKADRISDRLDAHLDDHRYDSSVTSLRRRRAI